MNKRLGNRSVALPAGNLRRDGALARCEFRGRELEARADKYVDGRRIDRRPAPLDLADRIDQLLPVSNAIPEQVWLWTCLSQARAETDNARPAVRSLGSPVHPPASTGVAPS
jgi:hypothetical protein